jgi:hypothetical protein
MSNGHEPAKRLGDLCRTISFSRANIVAGTLVIAMTSVPGAVFIVATFRAAFVANWALPSWIGVGVGLLVGGSMIINGLIFAKMKKDQLTHRFDFCANGFRYFYRGALDRVLWSQVSCIREMNPPSLRSTWRHYRIITASGKEYDIKGRSRATREFAELLRHRAEELSLPWENAGERNGATETSRTDR